jgi:DNA repair photolyase
MATPIRWRLENDPEGQGTLFDDEIDRHIGRGEFRGMEFLHVRAQRIINTLPPGAPLPFRHTINAYRGCSHACSYCMRGSTLVLLANGRTRPIADLRPGDLVLGTERVGSCRRPAPTTVLDQWSTRKRAYGVTLGDGAALVASGDHRFLSDQGWRHVTRASCGRPHLTNGTRLIGLEAGSAEPTWTRREVASIEDLRIDIPMYDITTGTGDFIADGVVSHNCFARPTHEYLGLNATDDFDSKIVVKINAVERLRAELDARRWPGEPIAMGTNTDPYQRCEGKYHLTRGLVEVLLERGNPFSILTKSTLILRDLDLLAEAGERGLATANLSIGTLDEQVWRETEPGTPHPARRLDAVAKLNAAGVPTGVLMGPILPGLSDDPAQLEAVVKGAVAAGAVSISSVLLHLRPGVRDVYLPWLAATHPELVERYRALYARSYAPKADRQRVSDQVRRLITRHRGTTPPQPFRRRPDRPAAPATTAAPAPRQLPLL